MLFKPLYTDNENSHKISWSLLSLNPNAIPILETNLDKINWLYLSRNPNAIPILENNLDKVIWYSLSENPNAIHLLENNLDKVDWESLSRNPNAIHLLFKYDYETMKQNNKDFCQELVQKVFNPDRLLRLCEIFNIDLLDYTDILIPE
jgi:hypothetical protein